MSEIKYEIVRGRPTPSLPKCDIQLLGNYSNFQCRIWGGCPPGRVGLELKSTIASNG